MKGLGMILKSRAVGVSGHGADDGCKIACLFVAMGTKDLVVVAW